MALKANLDTGMKPEGIFHTRKLTSVKALKWEVLVFKNKQTKPSEGSGLVYCKL